jgi:hypothetical protein
MQNLDLAPDGIRDPETVPRCSDSNEQQSSIANSFEKACEWDFPPPVGEPLLVHHKKIPRLLPAAKMGL